MHFVECWIKRCFLGYCEARWLDRLRIRGTPEFCDRTTEALGLLEEAGHSEFIAATLTELCQGLCSCGYILPRGTSTYVVGEFTWRLTPTGYASMIAHHAFRKSAYQNTDESAVTSTEADCLCFQEEILQKLQATDEEWDEATGLAMSEAYRLFSDVGKRRLQGTPAEDRKCRYGLIAILPDRWFYSTVEHRGIKLRGNEEFIAHNCRALELLTKIPEWSLIADNIRSIKQSSKPDTFIRTGGKAKGVITVCWPSWRKSSAETYAGVIAHEAYHNQVSRDPKARIDDPTGIKEERTCNKFEIHVLKKLGDPENRIRVYQIASRFPTHVGSRDNAFDLIWNIKQRLFQR